MNYNEILKLPEGVHIVTVNTERCMVIRLQEGFTLTTFLPERMMLIQHYSEKGHLLSEERFECILRRPAATDAVSNGSRALHEQQLFGMTVLVK